MLSFFKIYFEKTVFSLLEEIFWFWQCFGFLTDTAFGNNVTYLDPVASKGLQIKLELLFDRKNGITEYLEASFGRFIFSKIFSFDAGVESFIV